MEINQVAITDSTIQTGTQATNPIFDFTSTFNAALAQAIHQATQHLHQRIAELEVKVNNLQSTNADFIKEIAEEVAEQAMNDHNHLYDHDEYDRFDDRVEEKVSDAVTDAIDEIDFEDKVRDIMRHASVSIDI